MVSVNFVLLKQRHLLGEARHPMTVILVATYRLGGDTLVDLGLKWSWQRNKCFGCQTSIVRALEPPLGLSPDLEN